MPFPPHLDLHLVSSDDLHLDCKGERNLLSKILWKADMIIFAENFKIHEYPVRS